MSAASAPCAASATSADITSATPLSSVSCMPVYSPPDSILQLHRSISLDVYHRLPGPKDIFHWFLWMLESPRASSHLELITKKLLSFAKLHGLQADVDSVGNIRMRRPAAKGFENAPKIALQSHIDMVTSKTNDKVHDFIHDPIDPILDKAGKWLHADRTTLGADNGIGGAISLSLLTDPALQCGQLEALITVDEETTMEGAEKLAKAPFLDSDILINIDSEEPDSICIGCAGGFERKFHLDVQREAVDSTAYAAYELKLFGLRGGHTGVDVHRGRANALILLARLLDHVAAYTTEASSTRIPIRLISFSGGNAPNAIPRDAEAKILVPITYCESLQSKLKEFFVSLQQEFRLAELNEYGKVSMQMEILPLTQPSFALGGKISLTVADTRKVIDLSLLVPHGVLKLHPVLEKEVDTSISFSLAALNFIDLNDSSNAHSAESSQLTLHLFCRSPDESAMAEVNKQLDRLARVFGCHIGSPFNSFVGWNPNPHAKSVAALKQTHKEIFPKNPLRIYSVHAGLECGLIQMNYPDLDCASVGPLIEHAHSPQERLDVHSVGPTHQWIRAAILNLAHGRVKLEHQEEKAAGSH